MISKSKLYKNIAHTLLFIGIVICTFGCINDQNPGPIGQNSEAPNLTHNGYWIANEGGFTLGQASLSFLDVVEDTLYNNVFQAINGRPLGDVLQSINYYKGKAYLIINNSRKIEVVDSITFQSLATITELNSPRELLGFQDKLFVTDLYSNKITVLDATTYQLIDEIETGGWNSKMLIRNDELFVTQRQIFSNNIPGNLKGLWKFNAITHDSLSFIDLAQGANSIALDKNDKLWVLCDGGLEEEVGGFYRINPADLNQELFIPLKNEQYSAGSMQMDIAKETMYFIMSDPDEGINSFDIMEMNITDNEIPTTPFYDGGNLYLYGFYLDENRQELFFTDAVGLIQEGFCYRINSIDKTIIAKYPAGIFPSQIYPRY